jgi:phage tail-like protein
MPNSRPIDPFCNGRFRLEIDGLTVAAFGECDGLELRIDVIAFANGGDPVRRKRPGRTSVSNLVLRRGSAVDADLWNWFRAVRDGHLDRRNGAVIVLDDNGSEALRYLFFGAWPCRWKSLELRALGPGELVEEIELAVEQIERG